MGDKIHIRERNDPENQNKQMEERRWTAGKVVKAILATIFGGIVGGVVYVVMTNNLLKQKNRLVDDHNDKIDRDNANKDNKNDKKNEAYNKEEEKSNNSKASTSLKSISETKETKVG